MIIKNIINESKLRLTLNEDDQEVPSVETEVVSDNKIEPEGPKQGVETGIANVIHDLIIDENEAIQAYNNAAANMEDYPELQKLMSDIAGEEFTHIGELQKALELLISPNASNINKGEVETEDNLDELDPGAPVEESLDEAAHKKLPQNKASSKNGKLIFRREKDEVDRDGGMIRLQKYTQPDGSIGEDIDVLDESLYIADDLKLLKIIDKAIANNDVSGKLTKDEIESLANSINELLHEVSEKKPIKRRF